MSPLDVDFLDAIFPETALLTAPITWALDGLVEATPELKEAYRSASRTLAGDPDNIDARFTRAVASLSLRLYEHALADFGTITRLRPEHARTWLLTSEALSNLGKHAEADAARKHALELDPSVVGI
jgi:tetratricopeptide (TPR) repeat protein